MSVVFAYIIAHKNNLNDGMNWLNQQYSSKRIYVFLFDIFNIFFIVVFFTGGAFYQMIKG